MSLGRAMTAPARAAKLTRASTSLIEDIMSEKGNRQGQRATRPSGDRTTVFSCSVDLPRAPLGGEGPLYHLLDIGILQTLEGPRGARTRPLGPLAHFCLPPFRFSLLFLLSFSLCLCLFSERWRILRGKPQWPLCTSTSSAASASRSPPRPTTVRTPFVLPA